MSTDVGVQVSSLAPASEQSPLCSGAFYFTGNRKHHPLRSLAPPFQIEPVLCTGLRFGFLCPKLKNMLLLFEQASYRLLRLFMPVAKKSECAHSAAPPPRPGPTIVGLRVCFLWQSPLCSDVFYFTGNRKRHPPAPLLLLPNRTRAMHWASIWVCGGCGRYIVRRRRIFLQKTRHFSLILSLLLSNRTHYVGPRVLFSTAKCTLQPHLFVQ